MARREERRSTGDDDLDRRVTELLGAVAEGTHDGRLEHRDQLREILTSAVRMAIDVREGVADRLDVKIANAAFAEMRDAYRLFAPLRGTRKVTIFGSARTQVTDPLYVQTRDLAAAMAEQGWQVITGAGPGIMAAGLEGAGRSRALGVSINLPFESAPTEHVDPDRLVDMRYFFTRKLALVRESDAFVVMPGGFGTLDEAFELLTLVQTGKERPVPMVMLGLGHGYWTAFERFVDKVVDEGYISPSDRALYRVTNDVATAVHELTRFYANHHSVRWVGPTLSVRMHRPPDAAALAALREDFASHVDGAIEVGSALPAESDEPELLSMPRLLARFDRRAAGELRLLIDRVNSW